MMAIHRIGHSIYVSDPQIHGCRPSLGVVDGGGSAVLIDCGASPAHREAFLSALPETIRDRLDVCLLTHAHWDHYAGGRGNLSLGMTDAAWKIMRAEQGRPASIFSRNGIRAEYGTDSIPYDPSLYSEPEQLCSVQTSLTAGNIRLELIPMDSDHICGNLLIWVPDEKAIFTGDALYTGEQNGVYYYTDRIFTVIRSLLDIPVEVYIMGHHLPIGRQDLERLMEHLHRLSDATGGIASAMRLKADMRLHPERFENGSMEEYLWMVNGNRIQLEAEQ